MTTSKKSPDPGLDRVHQDPPFFISGLPRSGTTYVGTILDQDPSIVMFNEPLNDEFGLRRVTHKYPYVSGGADLASSSSAEWLDAVLNLRGGWRRFAFSPDRSRSSHAAKIMLGSRVSWRWRLSRLQRLTTHAGPRVCIKDPFATFALDHLARQSSIRSVCMVRHPAAYYLSFRTQRWRIGMHQLANEDALRLAYGEGIDDRTWKAAAHDQLVYCGLLWKMMARAITDSPMEVLSVRHEDLSLDADHVMDHVTGHLGLDYSAPMREFVERTTHGSAVAPQYQQFRQFNRNSASLVDYWRGAIDIAEQSRLRSLVADDLERFYAEW